MVTPRNLANVQPRYYNLLRFVLYHFISVNIEWRKRCLHDCQDVLDMGFCNSGVYYVTPYGSYSGLYVYCDMKTEPGGWLVCIN